MPETAGRPRVVYITGWCRSGTTLIGNLLGELDDVVHVGELHYLFTNAVARRGTNSRCGCGADLCACPLWSAVLDRVGGDVDALARDQGALLRTRHTRTRLAEATGARPRPPRVTAALARMTGLYAAIAEAGGNRTIVDSGKFPAEAAVLCGPGGPDVRVLHVVRDPRATAESWRRAKSYIPAMRPARSTAYWVGFNLASEAIGRARPCAYLRVRYEDFAARPYATLAAIMRFLGIDAEPPVTPDGAATLGVNHTVTGNPDRLRRGPVRVAVDDAWLRTQPRGHRLISTAVAAPLLAHYGYPLRPARGERETEIAL